MDMGNLNAKQAANFVRKHKGKIYVDVVLWWGDDYIRTPAVKSDLINTLEAMGETHDGITIFTDDAERSVLSYAYE